VTDVSGPKKTRVLVADDSALMRRTLVNLITADPELEVIGVARDGEDAVQKARDLRPDVMTMDINMPKFDGITAMQHVVDEAICPVIMVSSLTQQGAVTTFEALELGAFDYVAKPEGTISSNLAGVGGELVAKIKSAARTGTLGKLRSRRARKATASEISPRRASIANSLGYKAIAIGISTGGPSTLAEVLPFFPADLPAAVFLVQHMPAKFLPSFAERMNRSCAISVVLAEPGQTVRPGTCYVAKGDTQIALFPRIEGQITIRTPTYPRTLFMPSVGVMMKSVLSVFGADTIGVLMTGIGDDGAEMMVKIREAGGHTIAESDETAVVFGMPKRAIDLGGAKVIAPSFRIAEEILNAL
jgi:two-component system chemotaxis response regulator CheB